MATVATLRKRILSLKGRETALAIAAMNENEEPGLNLVASQLAQGIKSDGSKSDFSYTFLTIALKKGKPGLSGVTDHLTNYDTGESYRKMYMHADEKEVKAGTKTDKEEAISERMEGKAFILTDDNRKIYLGNFVQGTFVMKVKSILKL